MQKSVIEYLVNSAAKYPQKSAVQDSTGSITFSELLRSAFVIADVIKVQGLWRSPIGVYIPIYHGNDLNIGICLGRQCPKALIQIFCRVIYRDAY